jgi:hypothetical protein
MVTQLAREAGAYVIGTGRAADREKALDFGAQEFLDFENDTLEDIGEIVQRVRDGRVRTNIGTTASLGGAVPALTSPQRRKGKTVILVRR